MLSKHTTQLLYSSNTASTVVKHLTVLSSTTDKINRISNNFFDRWRHEFMRDTTNSKYNKYKSKVNIDSPKINIIDSVFSMKRCPDTFGRFP